MLSPVGCEIYQAHLEFLLWLIVELEVAISNYL
jgi:hypothetical protein